MKAFAGGRFTGGQFPASENCRSTFPCETKCQWGLVGLLGLVMPLLGKIVIKEGLPGLSPGVQQYIHRV